MVVFSCKNSNKKACEGNCEEAAATEECCANHKDGECQKAEGEQCAKCKEAALEALDGIDASAVTDDLKLKGILSEAEVEVKPTFNGGSASDFLAWVNSNINYPESAKENDEQGKVIVNFVVDKAGKVSDVKVLRGVSEALDAEAVRVVSESPAWTPATAQGKPVAVNYTLPVVFALK